MEATMEEMKLVVMGEGVRTRTQKFDIFEATPEETDSQDDNSKSKMGGENELKFVVQTTCQQGGEVVLEDQVAAYDTCVTEESTEPEIELFAGEDNVDSTPDDQHGRDGEAEGGPRKVSSSRDRPQSSQLEVLEREEGELSPEPQSAETAREPLESMVKTPELGTKAVGGTSEVNKALEEFYKRLEAIQEEAKRQSVELKKSLAKSLNLGKLPDTVRGIKDSLPKTTTVKDGAQKRDAHSKDLDHRSKNSTNDRNRVRKSRSRSSKRQARRSRDRSRSRGRNHVVDKKEECVDCVAEKLDKNRSRSRDNARRKSGERRRSRSKSRRYSGRDGQHQVRRRSRGRSGEKRRDSRRRTSRERSRSGRRSCKENRPSPSKGRRQSGSTNANQKEAPHVSRRDQYLRNLEKAKAADSEDKKVEKQRAKALFKRQMKFISDVIDNPNPKGVSAGQSKDYIDLEARTIIADDSNRASNVKSDKDLRKMNDLDDMEKFLENLRTKNRENILLNDETYTRLMKMKQQNIDKSVLDSAPGQTRVSIRDFDGDNNRKSGRDKNLFFSSKTRRDDRKEPQTSQKIHDPKDGSKTEDRLPDRKDRQGSTADRRNRGRKEKDNSPLSDRSEQAKHKPRKRTSMTPSTSEESDTKHGKTKAAKGKPRSSSEASDKEGNLVKRKPRDKKARTLSLSSLSGQDLKLKKAKSESLSPSPPTETSDEDTRHRRVKPGARSRKSASPSASEDTGKTKAKPRKLKSSFRSFEESDGEAKQGRAKSRRQKEKAAAPSSSEMSDRGKKVERTARRIAKKKPAPLSSSEDSEQGSENEKRTLKIRHKGLRSLKLGEQGSKRRRGRATEVGSDASTTDDDVRQGKSRRGADGKHRTKTLSVKAAKRTRRNVSDSESEPQKLSKTATKKALTVRKRGSTKLKGNESSEESVDEEMCDSSDEEVAKETKRRARRRQEMMMLKRKGKKKTTEDLEEGSSSGDSGNRVRKDKRNVIVVRKNKMGKLVVQPELCKLLMSSNKRRVVLKGSKRRAADARTVRDSDDSKRRSRKRRISPEQSDEDEHTLADLESFLDDLRGNRKEKPEDEFMPELDMPDSLRRESVFLDRHRAKRKAKLMACVAVTAKASAKEARFLEAMKKSKSKHETEKDKIMRKLKAGNDALILSPAQRSGDKRSENTRETTPKASDSSTKESSAGKEDQSPKQEDSAHKPFDVSFVLKNTSRMTPTKSPETPEVAIDTLASDRAQALLNILRAKKKAKKASGTIEAVAN